VHIETTTFERAIHLLLYVVGGVAFAVAALAVLERVSGATERAIRLSHVSIAVGAFAALAVTELLFHLLR
jgi:hypothetical protein